MNFYIRKKWFDLKYAVIAKTLEFDQKLYKLVIKPTCQIGL